MTPQIVMPQPWAGLVMLGRKWSHIERKPSRYFGPVEIYATDWAGNPYHWEKRFGPDCWEMGPVGVVEMLGSINGEKTLSFLHGDAEELTKPEIMRMSMLRDEFHAIHGQNADFYEFACLKPWGWNWLLRKTD